MHDSRIRHAITIGHVWWLLHPAFIGDDPLDMTAYDGSVLSGIHMDQAISDRVLVGRVGPVCIPYRSGLGRQRVTLNADKRSREDGVVSQPCPCPL